MLKLTDDEKLLGYRIESYENEVALTEWVISPDNVVIRSYSKSY